MIAVHTDIFSNSCYDQSWVECMGVLRLRHSVQLSSAELNIPSMFNSAELNLCCNMHSVQLSRGDEVYSGPTQHFKFPAWKVWWYFFSSKYSDDPTTSAVSATPGGWFKNQMKATSCPNRFGILTFYRIRFAIIMQSSSCFHQMVSYWEPGGASTLMTPGGLPMWTDFQKHVL